MIWPTTSVHLYRSPTCCYSALLVELLMVLHHARYHGNTGEYVHTDRTCAFSSTWTTTSLVPFRLSGAVYLQRRRIRTVPHCKAAHPSTARRGWLSSDGRCGRDRRGSAVRMANAAKEGDTVLKRFAIDTLLCLIPVP